MTDFRGTRYDFTGDPARPPLVLIHGVGLTRLMWRGVAEALDDGFAVVTYDMLGHGDSDDPDGEPTIADFAVQLKNLADHLALKKIAVAGFSMGALVARAFAAAHPQRLTHLALLHGVYQRSDADCAGVRERYKLAREHGPAAGVEAALVRWLSDDYRREHAGVADEIRALFVAHGDGYLKAYRLFAFAEAEMKQYPLAAVTCPALVVTGDADAGSTPAMARAMHRDLHDSRVIINRGHRHLAPVEHAEVIAMQLKEFLTA